jgi:hypothetical protein
MHIEEDHQEMVVNWFRMQYPSILMFAIPNGGQRGILEAKRLKLGGVLPGVPDLFIAKGMRGLNGLFVEMKRPKQKGMPNPMVSRHQQGIIAHLLENSYGAVICYGFDEAKTVIVDYLD